MVCIDFSPFALKVAWLGTQIQKWKERKVYNHDIVQNLVWVPCQHETVALQSEGAMKTIFFCFIYFWKVVKAIFVHILNPPSSFSDHRFYSGCWTLTWNDCHLHICILCCGDRSGIICLSEPQGCTRLLLALSLVLVNHSIFVVKKKSYLEAL